MVLSCTHSVVDTRKIGVAEAEYAFLQIRSKSIGEEVKPQVTCSACGTETNIKIRLDEIEMKKAEKEAGNLIYYIMRSKKIVCFEMVEINPTLDKENLMAENAFEILQKATNQLSNDF